MRERRVSVNPHDRTHVDVWFGRVCLFLSGAVFILVLDLVWRVS